MTSGSGGYFARTGGSISMTTARIDCASGASSYGASFGTSVSAATNVTPTNGGASNSVGALDITNCTYGIRVVGNTSVALTNTGGIITGNGLTYGIAAEWGGSFWLNNGGTSTITGGTSQLALDQGAVLGTIAGNAPTVGLCLVNPAGTGSRICHL